MRLLTYLASYRRYQILQVASGPSWLLGFETRSGSVENVVDLGSEGSLILAYTFTSVRTKKKIGLSLWFELKASNFSVLVSLFCKDRFDSDMCFDTID